MLLWARRDRFDCGGRVFRSNGGPVTLRGTSSAGAVAAAEAAAVAATVASKPSTARWLQRRAMYNPRRGGLADGIDVPAAVALAALRTFGFDTSAGLGREEEAGLLQEAGLGARGAGSRPRTGSQLVRSRDPRVVR